MLAKIWTALKGYKTYALALITLVVGVLSYWQGLITQEQAGATIMAALALAGLRNGQDTAAKNAIMTALPFIKAVPEPPALIAMTPELMAVQSAVTAATTAGHSAPVIAAVTASSLPSPVTGPMSAVSPVQVLKVMAIMMMMIGLAVSLSACAVPQTPLQQIYAADARLTTLRLAANGYEALPLCGTGICRTQAVTNAIETAFGTAKVTMAAAEMDYLGCSLADYVGSTATPPTATCGPPLLNTSISSQALILAGQSLDILFSAIPAATTTKG